MMYLSQLIVNTGGDPDKPRPGMKWIGNVYRVHQRLWMAFAGSRRKIEDPFFLGPWDGPHVEEPKPPRNETGFLFRIERDGIPRILVQSKDPPDWEYAFQNAPYLLNGDVEIKEFEPVFEVGRRFRFRLLANVVKRTTVEDVNKPQRKTRSGEMAKRRKRLIKAIPPLPLPDPLPADIFERESVMAESYEPWREWLRKWGTKGGFRIVEDPMALDVKPVYVSVRMRSQSQSKTDKASGSGLRYNAGLFEGMIECTDPERFSEMHASGIGPAKAFGFGLLSLARL